MCPWELGIREGLKKYEFYLDASQIEQLTQYIARLEYWNRTINLTALPLAGPPASTLDRLIFEPLRSNSLFPMEPFQWLDFGSGGGSPAIPLRIVLPHAHLTMVESRSRKAAFLRDVVRVVGLNGVQVLWQRAEALEDTVTTASVDVLTVRALRIDRGISTSVNRVLKESGQILLFGPVDWSDLAPDFDAPKLRHSVGDVTILRRRSG